MSKRREGPFDAAANLVTFNPARYGGYIVHLGVAVMMVGLTGSSVFKIEHDPVTLKKGENTKIGEYVLRFDGLARPGQMPEHLNDQIVALVTVFDQNGQITPTDRPLDPHIDIFKNTSATDSTGEEVQQARRPAIRMTPANDLYLVLDAADTKENTAAIKAYVNPLVMWIWVSMGFFVLGTIIAMLPGRRSSAAAEAPKVPAPRVEREKEKELVA
jgi:cytochrome c-type biogenesis protein CcmF